jgi:SAM-dependent methyltransferase
MGDPAGHLVPLAFHQRLLRDPTRMRHLRRAVQQLVRPGDRVLDVGAGTGILTMWALEAGAGHVFAVEPHGVIQVARRLAEANGAADRVTWLQCPVETLTLDQLGGPVDVVLAEALGNFFVTDNMQPALRHAGSLLAPGGRMLPDRVRLYVAPCSALPPELAFWSTHVGKLALAAALPLARQEPLFVHVDPESLLGDAVEVADFLAAQAPDVLELSAQLALHGPGVLTGVASWFEATLADQVVLRSGPGSGTHWGQVFLPVLPARVDRNIVVTARVRCRRLENPTRSAFDWTVQLHRGDERLEGATYDSEWLYRNDEVP